MAETTKTKWTHEDYKQVLNERTQCKTALELRLYHTINALYNHFEAEERAYQERILNLELQLAKVRRRLVHAESDTFLLSKMLDEDGKAAPVVGSPTSPPPTPSTVDEEKE